MSCRPKYGAPRPWPAPERWLQPCTSCASRELPARTRLPVRSTSGGLRPRGASAGPRALSSTSSKSCKRRHEDRILRRLRFDRRPAAPPPCNQGGRGSNDESNLITLCCPCHHKL